MGCREGGEEGAALGEFAEQMYWHGPKQTCVQPPERQSLLTTQELNCSHGGQLSPPQSVSVSSPSFAEFRQVSEEGAIEAEVVGSKLGWEVGKPDGLVLGASLL